MIISLTGFMGCGKSSVGRKLSELLCCPFMDLDAEEFIAKKGVQAKGKKVSALDVKKVEFIEPLHKPEDDIVPEASEAENQAGEIDNSDVEDPIDIMLEEDDPQLSLF